MKFFTIRAPIKCLNNSGIVRTLRSTSGFPRATAARCAIPTSRSGFAPALGVRLATTSALEGKIHQVIGAVVDGTRAEFIRHMISCFRALADILLVISEI